eukprot:jgi/Undpi1/12881/HiC_scaffold_7.g02547.m1
MAKVLASITTLAPTACDIDEAESSIKNASDMFRHGLAFDPMAGEHRHLSGQAPSSRLSLLTGSPSPTQVAMAIASRDVCPVSREPWDPPIWERLDGPGAGGGGAAADTNKRRRLGTSQHLCNNYGTSTFQHLPGPGTRWERWSVVKLLERLYPFRCLESSGVGAFNKHELVEMARAVVDVVSKASLVNTDPAMRPPVKSRTTTGETLRRRLPDLLAAECWIHDWEILRSDLPQMSETTIMAWFQRCSSLQVDIEEASRVLYRGLQRMMDLGALKGLRGVPCKRGNILWLRLRVARMYDHGEEKSDNRGECGAHRDDRSRLVATEVVDAFCTCVVGLPGGCHHVCKLLQLMAKELRTLREPKRQGVGSGDDEPAPTRGVAVGDRNQDFNPHPGGGVWLQQKTHFDKGITLSRRKWDCLCAFIDGERGGGRGQERAIDMNPPILSDVGSVVL